MIGAWETGTHGEVPSITRSLTRTERGRIMLIGDLHVDSAYCDRTALRYALDQAITENAPIIILGDVFDAMGSKGDRRASKAALLERYHGRDDYLNAMLEDAQRFLEPYAKNVWIMLHGNHDADVTKYHEVDLVRLLAHQLNRDGADIATPGYQTYVALKLRNSTAKTGSILWGFITHGHGGGAMMTGGVLSASRRAMWLPQADFVASGHLHRDFVFPTGQLRVTSRGKPYKQRFVHVQCGGWKNESASDANWANQKGMSPFPVGPAYWLEVRYGRGERPVPQWRVKVTEVDA